MAHPTHHRVRGPRFEERLFDLPGPKSGREEVTAALDEAAVHLQAGGDWSPGLRVYVDRWLDRRLELRDQGSAPLAA